jgi:hypothetical protein
VELGVPIRSGVCSGDTLLEGGDALLETIASDALAHEVKIRAAAAASVHSTRPLSAWRYGCAISVKNARS